MKLTHAEIQAKLDEVRQSYIASLMEKREAVDTHWRALTAQWQTENYQAIYLIIHSLAGSAETFGLSEISVTARRVINSFKQHVQAGQLDANEVQRITPDIERLTAQMAAAHSLLDKTSV